MLNDILTKEYIIQNGVEFENHLGYGGPYNLGIVEYTEKKLHILTLFMITKKNCLRA